jgi:hypothetical protein
LFVDGDRLTQLWSQRIARVFLITDDFRQARLEALLPEP